MPPVSTWSESVTDLNGRPLPGTQVTIFTDVAGTIPAAVFTDATGATPQPGSTYTTTAVGDPTYEPGNLTVFSVPAQLYGRALGQNRIFPVVVPVSGASLSASYVSATIVTGPGVDPTGVADSTAAIQAIINAAGPNATVVWPKGSYSHTGLTAGQAGQTWLLHYGAALNLRTAANNNSILMSAAGVTISGFGTVDGNVAGQTGGSGGILASADNVTIRGLTVQNTWAIGINCTGNTPRIEDCTTSNNGQAAIFCQPPANAVGPIIRNNNVTQTGSGYGIQLHGTAAITLTRAKIQGNDVVLPALTGSGICIEVYLQTGRAAIVGNTTVGGVMGISVSSSNYVSVTGNTIFGPFGIGIELAASIGCAVTGNTIDGNALTGTGIMGDNVGGRNHAIAGNAVRNYLPGGVGIKMQTHNDCTVTGNTVVGQQPIDIQASNGITVTGNALDGNAAYDCVDLDTCTNCTVANNSFVNAPRAGVFVYGGAMTGLIIGPNVLGAGMGPHVGGTTPLGAGSRVIRHNAAPAGLSAVAVTASPFTYTNNDYDQQLLYILGGTVSAVVKNGVTIASGTSATMPVPVWLEPLEAVTVTYTVAPTVQKDVK